MSAAHVGSKGLSPLARGNRRRRGIVDRENGSIPARTGEPARDRGTFAARRVYPRSHGGTPPHMPIIRSDQGLSPLARGNLSLTLIRSPTLGSIPARTGEPPLPYRARIGAGVYPRSHGGTDGVG